MIPIVSVFVIICYGYLENDYLSDIVARFETTRNLKTVGIVSREENWNIIF